MGHTFLRGVPGATPVPDEGAGGPLTAPAAAAPAGRNGTAGTAGTAGTPARPGRAGALATPLVLAAAALIFIGTYLALTWVPPLDEGFVAPVAQRIFYFHLGAALASYAAVAVTAGASALYLRRGEPKYDRVARDSAGLSLVFAATVLIEGSLWATAEWGTAWRWEDARLDSYLILALVFVGYLALRRAIDEPSRRARVAAAYALPGSLLVPLSFASVYLWQSLHPRVLVPGGQGISAAGGMTVAIFVVGYMLLYVGLLVGRLNLSSLEERVETLQRGVEAA